MRRKINDKINKFDLNSYICNKIVKYMSLSIISLICDSYLLDWIIN